MRNVLVAALLLTLAPALAGAQSSSGGSRIRTRECAECAQDSLVRAMHKQRMEHRDHRERVTSIARELSTLRRTLDDGQELSVAERRRLQARARRLESQLTNLETRMGFEVSARGLHELQPAMAEARRAIAAAITEAGVAAAGVTPERVRLPGWIGITLDAPCTVEARGGDIFWRFLDHPQIVSVDPSSPAERAGLRQGDILLAYDGQDVRRDIAMNRLLQPGRMVRVRVRVRRNNNEIRDVPVKVAPARDVAWGQWAPGVVAPRAVRRRSPRATAEVWTMVVPEPGQPVTTPEPRITPSPVISIARVNGLGGAHVETITPGLGEAIGVERGVLVISVPPGVPAQESGLVDGDVILRANGRDVGSVQELRLAVANSAEKAGKAVRLDVARKGKVRQVTLRW